MSAAGNKTLDDFIVRRLTADDAEDFLALRLEGLSRHPEAFGADSAGDIALGMDEWRRRLTDNPVFGGFRDDRLLAAAGMYRESREKMRHKGVLWGVYVTEAAQGNGFGRAVVEAAVAEARQLVAQLMTSVSVGNQAALDLYLSLGFQPWGVQPRALKIGERYIDEVELLLIFDDENSP
ncbi:MAG: GNAT family N-acetyltransferase [Cytophagales bacterium]|nr:GNAT family N-acetyltransferase [Cytophagales bacterium]